jgi:PAS domain S-box-containing protein
LPRASSRRTIIRILSGLAVRPRHIARVVLCLGLIVVAFIVARVLAERDARRDSDRRAEVAAVQIRGRIAQGASLTESLRRFMLDASGTRLTSDEFARNALRWLGPASFSAAAWVEQVPDSGRAAYERRVGHPIVTPDERRGVVPLGSRASYLPATLVSGFPPMAVPGIDLSGTPGMATAITRATRLDGVAATPVARQRTGRSGLFMVAPTPNLVGEVPRPGYVAVFVSDLSLRAAATDEPAVQIRSAGPATETGERAQTASKAFIAAGQRFDVVVPRESVQGAAAVLPWLILAGGLVVAALGGALGLNAARRGRAQAELDRIFTMSQDLIAVADFDGRFTRVNPAASEILGYTEEELLARPYVDLVHPADRESTAAEAGSIAQGKPTMSFENRYVRKDGSLRVLDWTTTPDVEHKLMYAVARDVTERRQAEAEVERLADEQAALRRVATLVARDVSQAEIFEAIAEEAARLFGTGDIGMVRYEDDRYLVVVASAGMFKDIFPTGSRQPLGGENAASRVFETGQPARIDDYVDASGPIAEAVRPAGLRSAVASPIMVEGQLWGAMITGTTGEEPLARDTEFRLGQFTELMATAIANTESQALADRLTEEQAALRRVATLVAQGVPAVEIFSAVSEEVGRLLGSQTAAVTRFDPIGPANVVVGVAEDVEEVTVGSRWELDDAMAAAEVYRTGQSARVDGVDWSAVGAPIAAVARRLGTASTVASPIVVEGRLWGTIAVTANEPLPLDADELLEKFTDLLATAIANADARAEVTASRARLLSAGDDARRRVVRDLHDGAQQRLVHTIVTLKLAQRAFQKGDDKAESLIGEALEHAERSNAELRELARGILPSFLSHGGLRAGVGAFAARLELPVQVNVPAERFPPKVEASAYFIAAEALTNVVKHSHAAHAEVTASVEDGMLRLEVRDDGIGGADPDGHGLVGLGDRATALGGRLKVESAVGSGTLVTAALPLSAG